jgi:hypothetical protein
LQKNGSSEVVHNTFDNATKLFSFGSPHDHIGVVTYGQASIGQRTAYSFVPEFEASLDGQLESVLDYAQAISKFYLQQWKLVMPNPYLGPDMTFIVGGFNNAEPHGRVYLINIPNNPEPIEQSAKAGEFSMTWGGQKEIVDRLIMGYDNRALAIIFSILQPKPEQIPIIIQALRTNLQLQIPLDVMALQDCVALARLFINTTINTQELTIGLRGCGGPVDIAIIRRNEKLKYIQRKETK